MRIKKEQKAESLCLFQDLNNVFDIFHVVDTGTAVLKGLPSDVEAEKVEALHRRRDKQK